MNSDGEMGSEGISKCCCLSMCEISEPISADLLMQASETGDLHFLRHALCVSREKIMEFVDEDGLTALHVASRRGHLPIVKFLLNSCKMSSMGIVTTPVVSTAEKSGAGGTQFNSKVSCSTAPSSTLTAQSARLTSAPESPEGSARSRTPDEFEKSTSSSTTCSSDTPHPSVNATTAEHKEPAAGDSSSTTQKNDPRRADPQSKPSTAMRTDSPSKSPTCEPEDTASVSPWAGKTTARGHTALHWAALKGHETCVAELIRHGFDVNATSTQGASPLQLAVAAQRVDVVKCLIQHGADVSKQTLSGSHPTKVSAYLGNLSLFDALKGETNASLTYFP